MHELAVTQGVLERAAQHAEAAGAGRVIALYLVLGEMSEITEDSVRFYWEEISRGTPVEGACLNFRRVPAELLCLNCKQRYPHARDEVACPACGSERVTFAAGEEFYLEAIEVERINSSAS